MEKFLQSTKAVRQYDVTVR